MHEMGNYSIFYNKTSPVTGRMGPEGSTSRDVLIFYNKVIGSSRVYFLLYTFVSRTNLHDDFDRGEMASAPASHRTILRDPKMSPSKPLVIRTVVAILCNFFNIFNKILCIIDSCLFD